MCLSLLAGGCLHAADAAPGFPPPHATVVLLTGLPGDVESENTYREQLQTWLDLLAARPDHPPVWAFFDSPEAIQPPANAGVTLKQSTRDEFLSLGRSLAGQTNPLVVIAWGHGGLQGSTPVFHVRGPRLTPADFKSFAAQSAAADSQWVLCFRGSGRFAADVAAPGRRMFASEQETMFASDPVAMAVWLRMMRSQAGAEFSVLAEKVGQGVADWYEQRGLARTEEPVWFQGDAPPRLLSPATPAEAPAKSAAAAASGSADTKPPAAGAAGMSNAPLPAVWKEIRRVEPQDYPDAEAVVLRRRVAYTLGSSPAIRADHEQFIQILTAEGKRHGDFDLEFSPLEDISFQDCEVLRADGTLVRLDPEAIREARPEAPGDYALNRRKFFSLPGVGPGAILHVRHQIEWKEYPLPHVSLEIPLGVELPVVAATLQVSVPRESAFHFKLEQAPAVEVQLAQASYGSTYTWNFHNLPAQAREPLAPPGETPRLLVSTFPDWQAFAEWYGRLIKLADEITPEIAAQAKELTRAAQSDREKVVALYNYVTSLRYVMVPLGVNSHRPHAAANVLRNQYGDCKDKANLLNALLRSLGFEAQLVLVPRFSQAHKKVPGLAFNHAISRVRLGDEVLWLDTTDDVCRFGMLPPGDPGRQVLVMDGKSASLTPLPLPQPSEHRLEIRAGLDLRQPSNSIPATVRARAVGHPDYELRHLAREMKSRRHAIPLLAARFKPAGGVFVPEQQTWTAVAALNEDFSWQANGAWVGVVSFSSDRTWVRAPFWLPREWEAALGQRQARLFLEQGYPLQLDQEFTFALPAGTRNLSLPTPAENQQHPLRWRVEWSRPDAQSLRARLWVELAAGDLQAEDTPPCQQQLRELLAACAVGAAYEVAR